MKNLKKNLLAFALILTVNIMFAQSDTLPKRTNLPDLPTKKITIDGNIYTAIIDEKGDTLILADLDEVSFTSLRSFGSDEDYQKYMKFRRYASTVFPYAKEAIRIFREYEYTKQNFSEKQAKKKLKELEDELEKEFEEPLKKLTKLQGKIMIKMIEKELNTDMHDLLKGLKGRFTAFYWHNFSKLYSYDLKEGYHVGMYPILDAVLEDFDVSHRIENESSMKYIRIEQLKRKK